MIICAIAVVDKNGLIGKNNTYPCKEDYENAYGFLNGLIDGNPIIVGRKTFESDLFNISVNQTTIVLTNDDSLEHPNELVHYAQTQKEALDIAEESKHYKENTVFVVGGESVYDSFFVYLSRMCFIELKREYNGNKYMIDFDKDNWSELRFEHTDTTDIVHYNRKH